MQTQLKRFRVQNFRSIIDSEWIDTFDNTCLIGTNESGKTNVLIGLWKLNPANDEDIIPLIDYPRKKYVDYAKTKGEEIFVSGHFLLNEAAVKTLKALFKKEPPPSIEEPQTENAELKAEEEVPVKKIEVKKEEPIEIATADEVSEVIINRKYNYHQMTFCDSVRKKLRHKQR